MIAGQFLHNPFKTLATILMAFLQARMAFNTRPLTRLATFYIRMRAPLVTGTRANVAAIQLHFAEFRTRGVGRRDATQQFNSMFAIGQIL